MWGHPGHHSRRYQVASLAFGPSSLFVDKSLAMVSSKEPRNPSDSELHSPVVYLVEIYWDNRKENGTTIILGCLL